MLLAALREEGLGSHASVLFGAGTLWSEESCLFPRALTSLLGGGAASTPGSSWAREPALGCQVVRGEEIASGSPPRPPGFGFQA